MIKLTMNKSTKNVLIATLPTVLTDAVGKVVRAISKGTICVLSAQLVSSRRREGWRRPQALVREWNWCHQIIEAGKNIQVHQGISRRNIIGTGKIL